MATANKRTRVKPVVKRSRKSIKAATKTSQTNDLSLPWLFSHLRWAWLLATVVFVFVEYWFGLSPSTPLLAPLAVVGMGLLLNGVYVGLLGAKIFPQWLQFTTVIGDIMLALILMMIFNQHIHLLSPLTLFPVAAAAVYWNIEIGLGVAGLFILVHAVFVLPSLGEGFDNPETLNRLLSFGGSALTLSAAGIFFGLPAQNRLKLEKQHAESVEKNKQAEIKQLQMATRQGEWVTKMALTLGTVTNYQDVLEKMLDFADSAVAQDNGQSQKSVGLVLLFEEEGDEGAENLTIVASHNLTRLSQRNQLPCQGLIGQTVQSAEPVISDKADQDVVLKSFFSKENYRSAICVPLRLRYSTYGVLLLCNAKSRAYTEEHKTLLTTLGSQASVALQNALLFEDVHQEQQRILEKEAETRRKLARDLHDGPTQTVSMVAMRLNFIKMLLQHEEVARAYKEISILEKVAQEAIQAMRTMLFTLRPIILETQGLVPAVEGYAERLSNTEAFMVKVVNRGYKGQLETEAEEIIFAIIEEAVGNAKKHSKATEIRISLAAQQDNLLVEIRDNGVGFDVEATKSTYDQRSSLGLINLDERARLIGGRCTIDSALGKGTAVRLKAPFAGD